MKKFKFRLEQVLRYRETLKQECERELGIANMKLHAEETHLAQLEAAFASNQAVVDASGSPDMIALAGFYGQRLKDEIADTHIRIEDAEKLAAEALEEYIEAAKEAKTLDTLKKKKKTEYLEYIAKEDEKFLDEMTVQRHGRSKNQ